jgi:NADPH:quinone reductase-like Zn-dependent oxidoreductase
MEAAFLEELGDPGRFEVRDVPDPDPEPGEVVVQVEAAALNARDGWITMTPGLAELPAVLGSDAWWADRRWAAPEISTRCWRTRTMLGGIP